MPAQANGPIYRRVGLLIEVICMLGLISISRGHGEGWRRAGLDPSVLLALGLGVGFALWAFGTFLILRQRHQRSRSKTTLDE